MKLLDNLKRIGKEFIDQRKEIINRYSFLMRELDSSYSHIGLNIFKSAEAKNEKHRKEYNELKNRCDNELDELYYKMEKHEKSLVECRVFEVPLFPFFNDLAQYLTVNTGDLYRVRWAKGIVGAFPYINEDEYDKGNVQSLEIVGPNNIVYMKSRSLLRQDFNFQKATFCMLPLFDENNFGLMSITNLNDKTKVDYDENYYRDFDRRQFEDGYIRLSENEYRTILPFSYATPDMQKNYTRFSEENLKIVTSDLAPRMSVIDPKILEEFLRDYLDNNSIFLTSKQGGKKNDDNCKN